MPPPDLQRPAAAIVLPPVWSHVYLTTAALLRCALETLGVDAEVSEYDGTLEREWSILLGWSLLERPPPPGRRYVLYQLEPLALPHWQERLAERRALFEGASAIWDYSQANLPYLRGLPAEWVPLGHHPGMREVALEPEPRELDVLFVGYVSPRRRALLDALSARCAVFSEPRWGSDLRHALARAKLVLNVHQHDLPTPLEQPRVAYALNQGALVLSETAIDAPYDQLPTAPYERLVEAALHHLHHPAERRAAAERSLFAFEAAPMTRRLLPALERTVLSAQRQRGS